LKETRWEVPGTHDSREKEDQYVYCRFPEKGKLSPGMDNYFKCLDILTRALTGSEERKNSHMGQEELLWPFDQISQHFHFKIAVRCQPKLERDLKGEVKFHVDFDLVPMMLHGQNVSVLLEHYFVSKGFAPGFQDYGFIKQMLCGVRVLYRNPGPKDSRGKLAGTTIESGNKLLVSPILPRAVLAKTDSGDPGASATNSKADTSQASFFIRDLKAANEMGRLFVNTKDGCKTVKTISPTSKILFPDTFLLMH
jgi:hypothetical protein